MTGLEKILKVIEEDALALEESILHDAQLEAKNIMESAKKEADKKCAEIALKSEQDVKAVLSRAESAAALLERKKILDAKQQIIGNVIIAARNSLANLPDSDYLEIILKMVKKYAHNKEGEILFSSSDKKRLPNNFETILAETLAEKKGAHLSISEATGVVDGGFILKYGDIEENCSFDALFSASKEELQDIVNAKLFD